MTAENIANDIAARQGWSDATLLDLVLTFVDRQQDNDAFADYLNGVAEEENSAGDLDPYGEGDDDEAEGDDAVHDALHSAAEHYASEVNNAGRESQRAFLLASGVSEQDIATAETENADEEDGALDMLVVEVASQTASRAYNNNGTPDEVHQTLSTVYSPHAQASTEFEDESHG